MQERLLTETERAAVMAALEKFGHLRFGRNAKVSAYLAEKSAERNMPLSAFGYLLQAEQQGYNVPADVKAHYEQAADRLSDAEVSDDYDGALLVGKLHSEFRRRMYYLLLAAKSPKDKDGVAALLGADLLTTDLRYYEQSNELYRLAAAKGNPDLLPT